MTPEGWVHDAGCPRNLPARSAREQDILIDRETTARAAAAAAFNLDEEMPTTLGPTGPHAPLPAEVDPATDTLGMGLPSADLTDARYSGQPEASGLGSNALNSLATRMQDLLRRKGEHDAPSEPPSPTPPAAPPAAPPVADDDDPFMAFLRSERAKTRGEPPIEGTGTTSTTGGAGSADAPKLPREKSRSLDEARRRRVERETQREAELARPFGDGHGEPLVTLPEEAARVLAAMHLVQEFFGRTQPEMHALREQEWARMRALYRQHGALYGETEAGMWLWHYEQLKMAEYGLQMNELAQKQERFRLLQEQRDRLIDDEWAPPDLDAPPR